MTALPDYVTPEDVAQHFGASARTIRETARKLGLCVIIGKRMVMLPQHVTRLIEELTPCPASNSSSAAVSGTLQGLSPDAAFAALQARQTKQQPSGSKRKPKPSPGKVISMVQRRT